MLYVLVAGGPGTGKTTLVGKLFRALSFRGFKVYVVRDWAREIIREELSRGGKLLPWIDRVGFEVEVVRRHLAEELAALKGNYDVVLEDSGPYAPIAYCRADGLSLPKHLVKDLVKLSRRVDLVLITEPPEEYMKDCERWEDAEYARRIHREVVRVHEELFSGRVVKVPPYSNPSLRVSAVLKVLTQAKRRVTT